MSEIIWGIDASYQPIKRVCKEQEIMCEFATEFGYCKITGCVHRTIHYGAKMDEVEEMKTCDKCQYCYEQSNHYKGAEIHTIHYRCHLIEKAVNPYDSCEMWKERKGKMEIRYKDGYVDEVKE